LLKKVIYFEPRTLGPHTVHTQDHGRPVAGFGTTSTSIDIEYCRHFVFRLVECRAEFGICNQFIGFAVLGIYFFFGSEPFFLEFKNAF
jgi:hypothetical protein